MNPWLLSIPLAYLLGSIPFGYLLVRAFRREDVRASGSGNIGATNVARSGGKALGVATLLLDFAKGAVAVLLAFFVVRHHSAFTRQEAFALATLAAVAAVLGHVFPVWLGFRGGALGVFLVLVPLATLGSVIVFLLVFAVGRYVSLASIAAAVAFPILALSLFAFPAPLVLFGYLFIPLLVIVKHHGNIRRLLAGTESRFGRSVKVPA